MAKLGKEYNNNFYKNLSLSQSSNEYVVDVVLDILKDCDYLNETRDINIYGGGVIELGCGVGNWLSVFAQKGYKIKGVDGGNINKNLLKIPHESFVNHDLRIKYKDNNKYFLAVSIEVAEHLPESVADDFVLTLTELSDIVLFSAAIPHQRGTSHINEQWPAYWIEKFRNNGYEVVDCIRKRIWNNPNVAGCHAQNIFLYVKKENINEKMQQLILQNNENTFNLVHPKVWEELNNHKFMKILDKMYNNKIIYKIYTSLKFMIYKHL